MANERNSQPPATQGKAAVTTTEWTKQIQTSLVQQLEKKIKALPDGFNKDRFVLNSITMLNDMLKDEKKKKTLQNISQASIVMCMMKGAFLGLDFLNGECYAIPYGNELNFQTDYKGEIKVCKKHSINPIKDIFAKVVRKGDVFVEGVEDGKQKLTFNPIPFSTDDIIGAFAVVTYKDGTMLYETMSAEEIEHVRQTYSKAQNSQAWKESKGEMYKKTVLRRLCKFIDLDFEVPEQITAYSDGADVQFDNTTAASKVNAIAEKEKPVDIMQQIKAKQESPQPQPVEVVETVEEPYMEPEPMTAEEYAEFEQQYGDGGYQGTEELPFK